MADNLPSPTSPIGGGEHRSANPANNQRENEPRNERRPRTRQPPRKRFGLTKTKWREFAGFAVLIPWVWYDLIDSHGILKLCLLGLSLVIAQGVACSFWGGSWKTLSIWLVSLIPVAAMVWVNSQPQPKLHFSVLFSTKDAPNDFVPLTNDFLIRKDFSHGFKMPGLLIVPTKPPETNFLFAISLNNDSPITPQDLTLVMTLPGDLPCFPGTNWQKVRIDSPGYFNGMDLEAEQSWEYDFRDILPGLTYSTSGFQISPATNNAETYFSILIRAKDNEATQISFSLLPAWLPDGYPSQKGFIIEGRPTSSNLLSFTAEDLLSHLHK